MSDDEFNDDLDDGFDDESSFDDFDQKSLGDMWRNNPMIKVGTIVAATVTIFGAIMLFGGKPEKSTTSVIRGGSEVSSTPGTKSSPVYRDAIADFNKTEAEIAQRTGTSAIPVPIEPPVANSIPLPPAREVEAPLNRWKRLQKEREERQSAQQLQYTPPPVVEQEPIDNTGEIIQQMAEAMSQQMSSILENTTEKSVGYQRVSSANYFELLREAEEQAAIEAKIAGDPSILVGDPSIPVGKTIIPAGTIEYAQLLIEANTDSPGPILAVIASGPLAKSKLIGSFEEDNDLITISFNTIVVDGVSMPIKAVAIDPATTLSGMATDVDHRYFSRIALPMAAAFIEGVGSAISESGRTTITIQGETVAEETEETSDEQEIASGIEEAASEAGGVLDDIAGDIETLVIVKAGTPLGIFFLEPVTDGIEEIDTKKNNLLTQEN